jgi:hypothetical protein
MKSLRVTLLACTFLCGGHSAFSGPTREEPIGEQEFNKLKELIQPDDNEDRWNQIPWLVNLWQAREKAAAEGKPILLWEMDGHPLGCT